MSAKSEGQAKYRKVLDPERLCCYCDQPATMSTSVLLTDDMPGVTRDDLLADLVAGRPLRKPIRGAVRVVLDACDNHEDAVWWAAEDSGLPVDAGRESLTESTCPDPWHEDDVAYEASATAPAAVGGGWVESHYECPTCGFSTFSTSYTSPDIVKDSAYRFVADVMGRISPATRLHQEGED